MNCTDSLVMYVVYLFASQDSHVNSDGRRNAAKGPSEHSGYSWVFKNFCRQPVIDVVATEGCDVCFYGFGSVSFDFFSNPVG